MARVVKNPPANAGDIRDTGSIPGLERAPRGRQGNPFQYSYLENPMDRGACRATVHRVTQVTCCYAGQDTILKTEHGTTDWFKIGKSVHLHCILSLCLFNLYAEYIMQNAGLDDSQAGIKTAGRGKKPITLDMQMTPPLWQKAKRTKEPLDEGERGV